MTEERRAYYAANPAQRPPPAVVEAVVAKYAYLNAGIAAAANLMPGPLGMLAVVPEIIAVLRNQLKMIYDIGVANGKEAAMNAELLLAVFGTVGGGAGIGLVTVHGGRLVVKRAALRVIQRIIVKLGGQITQRALKALLAKYVPVAGAAALAFWAMVQTRRIGRRANQLLKLEIRWDDDDGVIDVTT